jgi:hypothetical protein
MKVFRHDFIFTDDPPYLMSGCREALPFDIEADKWEIVYDIKKADVVPIGNLYSPEEWEGQIRKLKEFGCTNKQLLMVMNIFDDCDTYDWYHWYVKYTQFLRENSDFRCVMISNTKRKWFENQNCQDDLIHYDLMFNRQKAYMTETDKFQTNGRVYLYFDAKKNFKLNSIQKLGDVNHRKIALCPNRIMKHNARSGLRRILKTYIKDKSVILGDPTHGVILEPEDPNMIEHMRNKDNNGGGLWMPIANKYYEQTYISIYIETCTVTNPRDRIANPHESITEKTFDPLIKGHFILPFSYAGIINDIKTYGFRLPNWINYDYDKIQCDRHRFAAFLEEADRLLGMDISEIEKKYVEDYEMLKYNRSVFWHKPYVPLHDEVLRVYNLKIKSS